MLAIGDALPISQTGLSILFIRILASPLVVGLGQGCGLREWEVVVGAWGIQWLDEYLRMTRLLLLYYYNR